MPRDYNAACNAVLALRKSLEEAGIAGDEDIRRVVSDLEARISIASRAAMRRSKPIAVGSTVGVLVNGRERSYGLLSVGTSLSHLSYNGKSFSFRLDTGLRPSGSVTWKVHPDDLFRILRDFKGGPTE